VIKPSKHRAVVCADCSQTFTSTSPRALRCPMCRRLNQVKRTIACNRKNRDKYPLGRKCIDCGAVCKSNAQRCPACKKAASKKYQAIYAAEHRAALTEYHIAWSKNSTRKDGCGVIFCDTCPHPDCILPAEADN